LATTPKRHKRATGAHPQGETTQREQSERPPAIDPTAKPYNIKPWKVENDAKTGIHALGSPAAHKMR